MDLMTELLGIIESETTLVRAGNVHKAMALAKTKAELSQRYVMTITRLKKSEGFFGQAAPELLQSLQRNHDVFRAMLQVNLTVLATAHAVSEGIIRGVNTEMRKKNMPQTYTSSGRRTVPNPRRATPLAISRTL
jgi:hypothetical protein